MMGKGTKREPFTRAMRMAVLERDNHTCQYCGATVRDGERLHVDHVIPVAKGGLTVESNLLTACATCNIGKAARIVLHPDLPQETKRELKKVLNDDMLGMGDALIASAGGRLSRLGVFQVPCSDSSSVFLMPPEIESLAKRFSVLVFEIVSEYLTDGPERYMANFTSVDSLILHARAEFLGVTPAYFVKRINGISG